MFESYKRSLQDYLVGQKKRRTRLVTKDGRCNIEYGNIKYRKKYLSDFWTTLVESRWRYVILLFIATHTLSWFFFAVMFYWVAYVNGDLYWQNPSPTHVPCSVNVFGLTSSYLLAMETQTGTGYGIRAPNPFCPGAVTIEIIQVVIAVFLNAFMAAIILAKISLPKYRAKTITFSEMAVISPRNDSLCLSIRVANMRKTLMIGSQIYGKLVKTTSTPDGETIILNQVNIDFMVDDGKDNLFFICPLTLYHIIDKNSPFFEMAVDTLNNQDFELVVFLDGTTESTSSSLQVRTSYIPQEIMWGYDFLPIISKSKEGKYKVDFSNFAKVVPVPCDHCSYCFHNISGHHHHRRQSRNAYDNQGFEEIDMSGVSTITKM
ncbi:ATP-sensitive inward rectifier potassium channel 1-like [Mastacembelus armatus]|uniref:ATP-sensitive inward rectifier potassium channel 1-like n=1 Tax=Mastacembelus armatus TaxID=205130 RepID=UPI000E45C292|nr:ATP-sensitive inward rectifier potassium channel 1-like [Mastacembelus armatus]